MPGTGHLLAFFFLQDFCRGHDSATKILSGVIICPGLRNSGYRANSFATVKEDIKKRGEVNGAGR
jgi:hypothetical protein